MTEDEKRLFDLRESAQNSDQDAPQVNSDLHGKYDQGTQIHTGPELYAKDLDESLLDDIPAAVDNFTQTPLARRKLLGVIYILLTYICLHGILTLFFLRKYHSLVLQNLTVIPSSNIFKYSFLFLEYGDLVAASAAADSSNDCACAECPLCPVRENSRDNYPNASVLDISTPLRPASR